MVQFHLSGLGGEEMSSWNCEQVERMNVLANDPAMKLAFYCSDQHGRAINGGTKNLICYAGAIHELVEPLELCGNALHATYTPHHWRGCRVWVVALQNSRIDGNKLGALYREIIGEILPEDCISASIGVRIGLLNLSGASLTNVNLWNANLSYANLWNANLSNANLSNVNLWNANLWNADLLYAKLSYANLSYANLSNVNLWNANLSYADLSYANLSYANLSNVNLSYANLSNVDLGHWYRALDGFARL